VRSSTGGCTNVCPPNFYVDLVENICSPCGTGCQQCTSLTQCNGCVDQNLTPLNGVCQRTCPAGANLVGNICICSFGVLQNSVCVSSCSNGFYAGNDRQCLPCTSPCLTCSGSPTSCSSCIAGFNYDAVNRVCNPSSACPYGAYLDTNGVCQRYCPFSYFLGGCIFQCPAGYQANAFNGCILSSSPTFCQAPLIQFGSSCVNSCPTGYTPNLVTRNCDQCLLNCL
jgi:proprotein convertase subtilisin/kexin type 5